MLIWVFIHEISLPLNTHLPFWISVLNTFLLVHIIIKFSGVASTAIGERSYGVSPKIQYTYEGGAISISCESHTVVRWVKDGHSIDTRRGQNYLHLEEVIPAQSGIYQCHGTKINNLGQLEDFMDEGSAIVAGKLFVHTNLSILIRNQSSFTPSYSLKDLPNTPHSIW